MAILLGYADGSAGPLLILVYKETHNNCYCHELEAHFIDKILKFRHLDPFSKMISITFSTYEIDLPHNGMRIVRKTTREREGKSKGIQPPNIGRDLGTAD